MTGLGAHLTDYRLDNLHPRLFEHIVQELAIGAVCSTLAPFGDGPDGGREAIFEGQTHYGPEHHHWNGYGVIQAKYHVRPQTPVRDAAWVRSELKKELREYTRKGSQRKLPEYYIFATNVVLSPGQGAGKDSVTAILRAFAEKNGLKGWDLWDYDKLRLLIGRDEKVRRSYRAWITPSDVLADLCESINTRRLDYYTLLIRYLQRELLADQYAQLEQAGHSADDAIPLSQVFLDLPTSLRPPGSESTALHAQPSLRFVATIIRDAAGQADVSDSSTTLGTTISLNKENTTRLGRYVLIGGPGQGKTTVGQYVCQVFRSALLADVPSQKLSAEAATALTGLKATWRIDGPAVPKARRLPFRIVLSDFAKSLASGTTRSLMGYLAHKFSANTDRAITAREVERILNEYPSIIVLDGLDEVPASTNRDEVMSAVSNFSIDVATADLDVMLIATS